MKSVILHDVLGRTRLHSVMTSVYRWCGVLALTYHRIGNPDGSPYDHGLWSAHPDAFFEQVRFCKSHLDVITPDDLPSVVARRRGRYALITFDDGYRDNYEIAFPILRAAGVPATFFVTTGFIDCPRLSWWDEIAWMVRRSTRNALDLREWFDTPIVFDEPDREHAVRRLLRAYKANPATDSERYLNAVAGATGSGRYREPCQDLWMTWDNLREMQAAGMTIGGHTINHPVLALATPEKQLEEIAGCSRRLAAELGRPMASFSYPVGGRASFDAITRECLRKQGVKFAFSYYGGFYRFANWDNYDIPRVPIERYHTLSWFRSIVALPQFFA